MNIVGYVHKWSVEPEGTARFMISSKAGRYQADIVRLIHGDPNPAGPGFKSEPVETSLSGEYEGRLQRIRPGSYVRVPSHPRLDLRGNFRIEAWIAPTLPDRERQALMSKRGTFDLVLVNGRLEFSVAGNVAQLDQRVERHAWYFVSAEYDVEAAEIRLSLDPLDPTLARARSSTNLTLNRATFDPIGGGDLLIGASEGPTNFYNGKIDAPRIFSGAELIAGWDFSAEISSRRVCDVSGNGLDGRTVNMPMRGATGHNWDGSETAWRHAPAQYGAIHFHEDDLDDAGWAVDLEWPVPAEMPSGVYAVRLQTDGDEDYIPFFVRPKLRQPTARILFLAPLFSYLAYANEQQALTMYGGRPDYPSDARDQFVVENRLLSLYDRHSDGSGVCYASWRRPLVNMRPQPLFIGESFPHQLSADLHLVHWLYQHGYEFDVVTDEDLHLEGKELLEPYSVVLTGSHCEYWSGEMLDAVTTYLTDGGRLMYLSGNGLYIVTQLDSDQGHTIEIRRDEPSLPWIWRAAPGESHLSTTGERGGMWERRGRGARRVVGVGSAGGGAGRPYERQPGSHDPRVAFIFEGVGDDELIGDFPTLLNSPGAANFEFDRLDYELGTPRHAILLARASGFSGAQFVEEANGSDSWRPDKPNPLAADMVYLEYPKGGAVFSAASCGWCSALSYNNSENNVSRITRNVLDRFARSPRP